MTKRSRKAQKSQTKPQEFIVVSFAEDLERAQNYETLLRINDIPVTIKQEEQPTDAKGIAVMVPEDFVDEAHVIIESQDAYDDFYDFVLEDEDDEDFNSDLFEEDF